jgi:hypothetical protein
VATSGSTHAEAPGAGSVGAEVRPARSGAGSNLRAYTATRGYLRSSTASCAGQNPKPGGFCTILEPFAVSERVIATDQYRIDVTNLTQKGNFRFFGWILPEGMTLLRIRSTSGGACSSAGSCLRE